MRREIFGMPGKKIGKKGKQKGDLSVLVDGQNLFRASERAGCPIETEKFRRFVNRNGRADSIQAFFATQNGVPSKHINHWRKSGVQLHLKETQQISAFHKKGDCDVEIAIAAMKLPSRVQTVILVSGDGDFIPLVRELQRRGKRVFIFMFLNSANKAMIDVADGFCDLDDYFTHISKKAPGESRYKKKR